MKTCLAIICLAFTLVVTPACTKAPPNLSPQAQTAFNKTRVIKAVDLLRDTAVEANATQPPILSTSTTRKVVTAHQSALMVMQASDTGWQTAVFAVIDEVPKNLPPNEARVIAPYVTLIKTTLNEVLR